MIKQKSARNAVRRKGRIEMGIDWGKAIEDGRCRHQAPRCGLTRILPQEANLCLLAQPGSPKAKARRSTLQSTRHPGPMASRVIVSRKEEEHFDFHQIVMTTKSN
jgi:hypothetical protein